MESARSFDVAIGLPDQFQGRKARLTVIELVQHTFKTVVFRGDRLKKRHTSVQFINIYRRTHYFGNRSVVNENSFGDLCKAFHQQTVSRVCFCIIKTFKCEISAVKINHKFFFFKDRKNIPDPAASLSACGDLAKCRTIIVCIVVLSIYKDILVRIYHAFQL